MAYTTNPYVGRTRRDAVNDVRYHGLTQAAAARKYGVVRSTIWKWLRRAPRHNREFINTLPSRPKHHPHQLDVSIVKRIIELRLQFRRCAPIIHAYLEQEGVRVSLSSVERVLRKFKLTRKKRPAKYYIPLPRPLAESPGALVQVDTIHFVRSNKTRFYIYALIDIYSRLAYAEYHPKFSQKVSLEVVKAAQRKFGFKFFTVQTDNGPEFGNSLDFELKRLRIALRHSRVRTPNDNAHIERFIRTLQEECFDGRIPNVRTIPQRLEEYLSYYNSYYNQQRLHLSLGLQTPTAFVSKVLT